MSITPSVERDAQSVLRVFRNIHDSVFAGDVAVNPHLEVEVIPVASLEGVFGEQSVVIVITPWTMNGIVLPGRGLPESMAVTGTRRPLIGMELPELGSYTQVALVGDVSRYTSQQQARTIAESMIPVLMAGLQPPVE